jgi:hypothetical protein
MSLAALCSAEAYADAVYHEELRIQDGLNDQACQDTVALIKAKDLFVASPIVVPEFGCALSI